MITSDQHLELAVVPAALRRELGAHWDHLRHALADDGCPLLRDPAVVRSIDRVWACSRFIAKYCTQDAARFIRLLESGDLSRPYAPDEYERRVQAAVVAEEGALMRALRRLRNRELVRIAWRDITGTAGLEETMSDLSRLAEAALDGTLTWLYRQQSQVLGTPSDEQGQPQSMVIIAMGKLGAHELNFSSDIDLIFAYPKTGETRGGRRPLSNQEFFSRLGQRLIKVLSEPSQDGFVFRIDMRLRPFGDSGPLVASFEALENYYATHARDWERYAMIKARVVAGDQVGGERLMTLLRPFVYRRYLDFGAIQALREMKQLIGTEVKRKGLGANVKLGPGGIREIEFIGQTFQLIRGGRVTALQARRILEVLATLKQLHYLPADAVDELTGAYRFLRNTEHRLQEVHDHQTQSLPADSLSQARLALGMGFGSWDDFQAALQTHRDRVEYHFSQLLVRPIDDSAAGTNSVEAEPGVWPGLADRESARRWLGSAGFEAADAVLASIETLEATAALRRLSRNGRQRLDRLMPMLLSTAARAPNAAVTVERLADIIEAVARRSVYLALLAEYPDAREHLVRLCSASPWIAQRIRLQPILLDELLDPRILYAPPDPAELEAQLDSQLSRFAAEDLEQEMEALRHFKHVQVLRVAAADVAGALRVATVSDHLSWIAETVLKAALRLARDNLISRHGAPFCRDEGSTRAAGFAIVAYGKLGGRELGYGSDLDLVFLHDSRGERQITDGPKPVDNHVFFNRLGQRMIHVISTATPAGKAYEIDTRLRPNGSSGSLVTSLDAYRDYQHSHAWTWEQQALIRARPVAGDPDVMNRFSEIRKTVLGRERDAPSLKHDIREMRERMRRELVRKTPGTFDLKQGAGGITDIEFMVQYAILRWAAAYPQLLEHTDNHHLLQALARSGRWGTTDCEGLEEAYFAYRARTHALALQQQPALVKEPEFQGQRQKVIEVWRRLLEA